MSYALIRNLIIYLLCTFLSSLSACRLWAVCAKTGFTLSTLPSNHKALVLENLEYYFEQSRTMPNGWALLNYDSIPTIPTTSVYRSSITAYNDSVNYWEQVSTLIDSGQKLVLSADSSVNDVVKVNAPTLDGGSATTFSCWLSIYEDVNS